MLDLLVETWLWFGICLLVAIGRFHSRYDTLKSFKRFCADDYLMVVVLAFFLTLIVAINIVADTNSNLLPLGFDASTLTEEDIRERTTGSKLVLVVEQCQCVVIWGLKTCLAIMYLRLTSHHYEHIAIKFLAAYIAITFIVMEILYFGVWCRPISNYWAVPTPDPQCNAATNHLITNAVFNISSDIFMLAIALPMFLKLRISWDKKAPIVMIFSLGIFVIIAAILNKVYSFSQPFGSEWTHWYVRESSTALLVCNLPFCWIFVRRIYKLLSIPFTSTSGSENNGGSLITRSVSRFGVRKRTPNGGRANDLATTNPAAVMDVELGPHRLGSHDAAGNSDLSIGQILAESPSAAPKETVTELTHPRAFLERKRSKNVAASASRPLSVMEVEAIAADDARMVAAGVMDNHNAYSMRRGSSIPESVLGSSSASRRTSTSWV